jgi:hypothetical protein
MRITHKSIIAAALAVLASLAAAPAANAAPVTRKTQACVINLADRSEACFPTYRESIAFATHGRITDAPADVRVALKDPAFTAKVNSLAGSVTAAPAPAASLIIATLYWNANFNASGLDHVFTYSGPSACTASTSDQNYFDSDLGAHSTTNGTWNNKTSSFQAYNSCWLKLYDNANFGGASTGYLGTQSALNSIGWNDRANSIIFS